MQQTCTEYAVGDQQLPSSKLCQPLPEGISSFDHVASMTLLSALSDLLISMAWHRSKQ